jgi:endonuclease/exonuclease/phosphatase family metal-dependent hydrolase
VVVTQELALGCAEVLESRYPNHRLRPADDFKGRGIATRLEAEFDDIPMPGREGTSARLMVGGRPWNLAGVHFLNPIEFPWWRSVRGRSGQVAAVQGWVEGAGSGPLLVAGDFNASPRWPAYREMDRLLTDLPASFAFERGMNPETTWAWRPGWPRMLRIDHVFGREVETVAVSVVPIEGSDNQAVVVDLVEAGEERPRAG